MGNELRAAELMIAPGGNFSSYSAGLLWGTAPSGFLLLSGLCAERLEVVLSGYLLLILHCMILL